MFLLFSHYVVFFIKGLFLSVFNNFLFKVFLQKVLFFLKEIHSMEQEYSI